MQRLSGSMLTRCGFIVRILCLVCWLGAHGAAPGLAQPAPDAPEPALALREQFKLQGEQLRSNAFGRPLVLQSTETEQGLRGDIYAVLAFPFRTVSSTLKQPQAWCEVMILHINTKYCHAVRGPSGSVLKVNIGRKTPQELAQAERVSFNYSVTRASVDYFEVLLDAKDGPLGTSDYRIRMEAVSLPGRQTFLHLSYSYSANLAARLAMQAYLATVGADKVGFTVLNKAADGAPVLIQGVRGVVERNTMRYYLAIDSYLQSRQLKPAAQFEGSLRYWFTAVEQYPRQLHEMDLPTYLEMKRAEHLRQQTLH